MRNDILALLSIMFASLLYCLQSLFESHPLKKYRNRLVGDAGIRTLTQVLIPTAHNTRRLIFIGDVHGCLEELKLLLKKCQFESARDHIIFVGDLVAKGPFSLETITYIDELGDAASSVRGNHDDKLMQWNEYLVHKKDVDVEKLPDGLRRRDEHRFLAKNLDADQVDYLESLPYIIRIPMQQEYIVVHAGLLPGQTLAEHKCWDVTNMRNIHQGEAIDSRDAGQGWFERWDAHQKLLPKHERKVVIYGHDAGRRLNMQRYSMGLDTGCCRKGELTALVLTHDSQILYHQKAHHRYD